MRQHRVPARALEAVNERMLLLRKGATAYSTLPILDVMAGQARRLGQGQRAWSARLRSVPSAPNFYLLAKTFRVCGTGNPAVAREIGLPLTPIQGRGRLNTMVVACTSVTSIPAGSISTEQRRMACALRRRCPPRGRRVVIKRPEWLSPCEFQRPQFE